MENDLSMSLNEVEKNPFTGECQGNIHQDVGRPIGYLLDFTKIILFDLWLLNENRFSKYYFCIFILKIGYSANLNRIGWAYIGPTGIKDEAETSCMQCILTMQSLIEIVYTDPTATPIFCPL